MQLGVKVDECIPEPFWWFSAKSNYTISRQRILVKYYPVILSPEYPSFIYFTKQKDIYCCRLRQQFKQLLEENHNVCPGKSLNEVAIFFLGRECFSNLPEDDKQQVRTL